MLKRPENQAFLLGFGLGLSGNHLAPTADRVAPLGDPAVPFAHVDTVGAIIANLADAHIERISQLTGPKVLDAPPTVRPFG